MIGNLGQSVSSIDITQLMSIVVALLFGSLVLALSAKDIWQFCFLTVLITTVAASVDLGPFSTAIEALRFPAVILLGLATLKEWSNNGKRYGSPRPKQIVSVSTLLLLFVSVSALSLSVSDNALGSLGQFGVLAVFVLTLYASVERWRSALTAYSDIRLINGALSVFLVAGFFVLPFGLGLSGERFTGVFSNANTAGLVATIVIPASVAILRWGKSYLAVVGIAAGTLTLLGSQARTSILSLLVAFAVWAVVARVSARGRANVLAAGVGLLAIGGFALGAINPVRTKFINVFARFELPEEEGLLLSGRENIWQGALDAFSDKPILGYGYGNAPPLSVGEVEQELLTGVPVRGITANSYIQILVETGILGFACIAMLVGLLVVIAVRLMRSADLGALGVLIIAGLLVQLTESPLLAAGQFYPWAFWFITLGSIMLHSLPQRPAQSSGESGRSHHSADNGVGRGG